MEAHELEIIDNILAQPKTAIIMIGIHATGKTYFYHQYFKNIALVSYDGKIRRKEQQQMQNFVKEGLTFVVDSNNITKQDRKPLFEVLKGKGYTILGFYFNSIVGECIDRNRRRANAIPDRKIIDMSKIIELPTESEFSDVYYVDNFEKNFELRRWE